MPREIEEEFDDCGTPLFPRSAGDVRSSADMIMSCSCPDWEVPCKHLAAVCYVLAEAFDDDPFAMLAWRGRGREELLAALRLAGPGAAGADAPRPVIDVTDRPLAECLDSFWSPGLTPARLRAMPTTPITAPDLLLRSFEPPPVAVRGKDLVDLLAAGRKRVAFAPYNYRKQSSKFTLATPNSRVSLIALRRNG